MYKPAEHDLSADEFSAGGATLTEQEVTEMIEELNQKGQPRKGKRGKVADERLVQAPRNLPFGSEDHTLGLKEVWERQNQMTREEIKTARIAELEAPVVQAQMIKVTNKMAEKKVKIIFFAPGKQTATRLAKDCFNFSCSIDQTLFQSQYWKDFFENKTRLCDLVKSPLVVINPEPSSDGTAFEHSVRMDPADITLWSSDQKTRYEAHIESQQVNCFHVQMMVITDSKYQPIRTYLKNWHGNPLLLSGNLH